MKPNCYSPEKSTSRRQSGIIHAERPIIGIIKQILHSDLRFQSEMSQMTYRVCRSKIT